MRTVIGGTVIVAGLAAVLLVFFDGPVELGAYEVLLLLLAGLALPRLQSDRLRGTEPEPGRLRITRARRTRPDTPPQLEKIERLVVFGKTTAFDAEWRLLPLLRSVAAEQLEARHGVDLLDQPDAARRLLGAEGWELLRPDRPPPSDRLGPGLEMPALDAAVSAIEGL